MAANGIVLPPGLDLTPLAASGIQGAIAICAGDYERELAATVQKVRAEMLARGLRY